MGKRVRKSTSDEKARNLDLVKAAAHAWFEHGSAGRKQMSAFDTSSEDLCASYKASRFKQEAAAAAAAVSSGISSSRHGRRVKAYSLLDDYEVESIVRNLEQVVLLDGSSRRAREVAGYLDGNQQRKEKESKKQTGTKWIKRGFACPTDMNDVAVATATRKSTSSLNAPLRQSNFKFHVLL